MKKLITETDILKAIRTGQKQLFVNEEYILTPLAKDRLLHSNIEIVKNNKSDDSFNPSSNNVNRIALASDHTGYSIKKMIYEILETKGYSVIDFGTNSEASCDYPDFAEKAASAVSSLKADIAFIFDATGSPSAITANKFRSIRAAVCYNEFSARSAIEHNNANVICIGAKALGEDSIKGIVTAVLGSKFLGDRHQRRIEKIIEIEKKNFK